MSLKRMIFGERRLFARKSCVFTVDVDDYYRNYACNLRNLSVGGALLDPPPHFKPKLGQSLSLNISYRNRPGSVFVKGIVVRYQPGQLAVAFEKSMQSTLHHAS